VRSPREEGGHLVSPDDRGVIATLRSADFGARCAVLEQLADELRPLSAAVALAVVDCLGASAKALQLRAVGLLGSARASAHPSVLASLRGHLCGADHCLRRGAAFALGQMGILEPAMLPILIEVLAEPDGDYRWSAAALLVACGRRHAGAVVPALLRALGAGRPQQRKMACYVLRDLVPGVPEVARALVNSLRDPDVGVRLAALSGLCRLDPLTEITCEVVLERVRDDPDPGLRRAAVSALGHVGCGVAAAQEALAAAAASDDAALRRAAAHARRRLEGA
jgi:HEAT repeat protein